MRWRKPKKTSFIAYRREAAVKSQPPLLFQPLDINQSLLLHMSNSLFKSTLLATVFVATQAIITSASLLFSGKIQAQTLRNFPINAVRGTISFKAPPEVVVDGKTERLSPGARIRDKQNMMAMTGALNGQEFIVNYRRENIGGMVSEVWLLTPEEIAVKREGTTQ